jgi:hypothetical protein
MELAHPASTGSASKTESTHQEKSALDLLVVAAVDLDG